MDSQFSAMWQPQIKLRNVLVIVSKGLISLAVIAIIFSYIDHLILMHDLRQVSAGAIVVALLILGVQTSAVAGLRLKLLLAGLHINRPLSVTWQVSIAGFFVEQIAFGMLGGDATRVWLLRRFEVPIKAGIGAIAIDRFVGLTALLLLAAAGLPSLSRCCQKPVSRLSSYSASPRS